jgi:hypothetical protein
MGEFLQPYGVGLLAILGTLLGTWVGYRLKASDEKKDRARRVRATWGAISAEVEACKRMATVYLAPNEQGQRIGAPQWRLPDVMLTSSLRALLADGDPSEPEVDALLKYHTEAETLNRGLDLAQEATGAADLRRHMELNDLKARRLVEGGEYYAPLRPLIDRHLG